MADTLSRLSPVFVGPAMFAALRAAEAPGEVLEFPNYVLQERVLLGPEPPFQETQITRRNLVATVDFRQKPPKNRRKQPKSA